MEDDWKIPAAQGYMLLGQILRIAQLRLPIRRGRYKILRIAMRKIAWPMMTLREEAEALGTDFDEAVARQLANDPDYLKRIAETALEEIIAVDAAAAVVGPIYAAIEAHRAAYAAYDGAAEPPDDENEEAFRELDRASQHLMRAEASTLAGLIAPTWPRYFTRLARQGCRSRSRSPGAGAQPLGRFARMLRTAWRRSLPRPRYRQTLTTSPTRLLRRPHRSSRISKWPGARPELRSWPSHHEAPAPIAPDTPDGYGGRCELMDILDGRLRR